MRIEKITNSMLQAAAYNPRKDLKPGDVEYEKLRRSIEEFGYVEPIIWNERTGNIVGGHQRFKVLAELGYYEIDCVVVELDAQREKALNVALNKISGEFDIPLLTELLHDLDDDGFDVSLTGFDMTEMEDLFKGKTSGKVKEDDFDTDKAAAEIETPITRRGDIWLLGKDKHRLMCGDSTSADNVHNLVGGNKARCVFIGSNVKAVSKRWGVSFTARITEIEETYDSSGLSLNVTFGKPLLSLAQRLKEGE